MIIAFDTLRPVGASLHVDGGNASIALRLGRRQLVTSANVHGFTMIALRGKGYALRELVSRPGLLIYTRTRLAP